MTKAQLQEALQKAERKIKRQANIIQKNNEEIAQLEQDVADMNSSIQTSFTRCSKCGRIYDSNYCCFYCGWDPSDGTYSRRSHD